MAPKRARVPVGATGPIHLAEDRFADINGVFAQLQQQARECDIGDANQTRLLKARRLCDHVADKFLPELKGQVEVRLLQGRLDQGKAEVHEATEKLPGALSELWEATAFSQPDPAAAGEGVGAFSASAAVATSAAAGETTRAALRETAERPNALSGDAAAKNETAGGELSESD